VSTEIAVVIPMRNEHAAVEPLFERMSDALDSIYHSARLIVVDGASTDGTPDEVGRFTDLLPVEVICLSRNLGLGGALDVGLQHALTFATVVVTMDGDNSHDPDTIGDLIGKVHEGNDLVIASRFQPGGKEVGVAVHRRLMSHAASGLLRLLFPYGSVRDYSSVFRAYRASVLESVRDDEGRVVSEEGFTCMLELLLKLRAAGARAAEVPLVLRYDRRETKSKMEIGRTVAQYLRLSLEQLPEARGKGAVDAPS